MSGLGRQQIIQSANGGVFRIINQGLKDPDAELCVTALQALHALLGNRFSLEDIMADSDFEGFYAECDSCTPAHMTGTECTVFVASG